MIYKKKWKQALWKANNIGVPKSPNVNGNSIKPSPGRTFKTPSPQWKRLRASTTKRAREMRVYGELRRWFLIANPWCEVCKRKKQTPERATTIHHTRGRTGRLLNMTEYWIGVSENCHAWIHRQPYDARAIGVLCALGKWAVVEKA